jgi:uncharacterized hydrophobic protein (TIGR00341 family)
VRLVQVVVPSGRRESVRAALEEEGIEYVFSEESSSRDYDAVAWFPLPTNAVEPTLERLREAGIGEETFTVVTAAETVVSGRFDELSERYAEEENEDRIAREELRSTAESLASSLPTYAAMTVLSAVVATAGLLLDSPATVVGSMVIAPLIGPAMAAAVGTVVDDAELFGRGVKYQALGLGLAVASAAAFAVAIRYTRLVPPNLDPTAIGQVRERLTPDFLSLAVALCSGAAGALSLTTGVSTALVGVMIAVALIPPAATVGLGLAYGLPAVALSSGVLMLVNLLSINLAALAVLWYSGYRPERLFREADARAALLQRAAVLLVAIAVLSVFLGGVTLDSVQQGTTEAEVRSEVSGLFAEDGEYPRYAMLGVSLEGNSRLLVLGETERVVLTVGAPPGADTDALADRLDEVVDRAVGHDVTTELRVVERVER